MLLQARGVENSTRRLDSASSSGENSLNTALRHAMAALLIHERNPVDGGAQFFGALTHAFAAGPTNTCQPIIA